MHPEKYVGPDVDEPTLLGANGDPTPALGDGWTMGHTNVAGELELSLHFEELLGKKWAGRAAAGWDGSRYWFCEKEGQPAFFGMVSTWDSELDAVEFARAWAAWACRRGGDPRPARLTERGYVVGTPEGTVAIVRAGRDVYVADGLPEGVGLRDVVGRMRTAERSERKPDARPQAPREDHDETAPAGD